MDKRMKHAMEALRQDSERYPVSPLLRDRILRSVERSKQREPSRQGRGKAKWLLVATLVFVFATGFASIVWYQIQNKDGETVMEYQAAPPITKERLAELQAAQAKMDEARSALAPGTAAAVYRKNEEGQGEVSYIDNPLMINELEEFKTRVKDIINYPAEIAGAYGFKEGMLSYDYEKDESLEESLKQRAVESNEEWIVEPVRTLPSIFQGSATYEDADGNLLRINFLKQFWVGKAMMTVPGANQKVEEVNIDGSEGLYIEREDPFGKTTKELRWVDQNWSFSIHSTDTSMTKENLLHIVNQILEKRS